MLGDTVEKALETVGITQAKVSKWLGKPCNCEERKIKLNALDGWARRVVSGNVAKAKHYLDKIMRSE